MHCPFREPVLYSSGSAQVIISPKRRTATISTRALEKDAKKNDQIIQLIQKKCKANDIKINGSKSNMSHEVKAGSFLSPSSKEVANLFWSCHIEGSNHNIGNVCAELYSELGDEAPKVDFHEEEVNEEEFAKAEEKAVELASAKARKKAEITATTLGIALGKMKRVSISSEKNYGTSMGASFNIAPQQMVQSLGPRPAAAPPAPLEETRLTKAKASVNLIYFIE